MFCTISGYGMSGPYKDMPSHGIAYDTWAGQVPPAYDDDGFCYIPEHTSIGIHAGPVFGSLGILAAIIPPAPPVRARSWRSRSPTPRPTSTGIASRRGRRTTARSPRSPVMPPTTTSGARPALLA